jgi:hypothetical protein
MDSDELVRGNRPLWPSTRGRAEQHAAAAPDSGGGTTAGADGDDVPESAKYQAFKMVDGKVDSLSIYTVKEAANAHPAYQYYQYMLDDKTGKIFDIVYGFFVVRVRGRNLLPVVRGIKSKRCVFIQEYQRRPEWPEPGREDTVIERIEIVYQPAARTAMLEKGGKA